MAVALDRTDQSWACGCIRSAVARLLPALAENRFLAAVEGAETGAIGVLRFGGALP